MAVLLVVVAVVSRRGRPTRLLDRRGVISHEFTLIWACRKLVFFKVNVFVLFASLSTVLYGLTVATDFIKFCTAYSVGVKFGSDIVISGMEPRHNVNHPTFISSAPQTVPNVVPT